jgi:hypothetical protein
VERRGRAAIGGARVGVSNVDGEELDEAPGGAVAGPGDERRNRRVSADGQLRHAPSVAVRPRFSTA